QRGGFPGRPEPTRELRRVRGQRGRSFAQPALPANERGSLRFGVLVQEIGIHQPRRVVVRGVEDRAEKRLVLGEEVHHSNPVRALGHPRWSRTFNHHFLFWISNTWALESPSGMASSLPSRLNDSE